MYFIFIRKMFRRKQIKQIIENNSMLLIIVTYAAFSLLSSGQKGDTGKDGAQGEKGDKGDTGSSGGQIGPKGDDGKDGADGKDGIGFEFKVFATEQSYTKNNYVIAVSSSDDTQNSLYFAKTNFTSNAEPKNDNTNWAELFLPDGIDGIDGKDIFKGTYTNTETYLTGDIVAFNDSLYILKDKNQQDGGPGVGTGWISLSVQDGADGIGFEFKEFVIGQSYTKNNYVIAVSSSDAAQNSLYFAKNDFTSTKEPKDDKTNWTELFTPDGIDGKDIFKGTYTNSEIYLIGDIVVFSNSLYILKDNTQQGGGPGVGTGWYHITNDKLVTSDSINVFTVAQEFVAGVVVKGSSSTLSFSNDNDVSSTMTFDNSGKMEIKNASSKVVLLEDGKVGLNVDPITDVHLNGNILIGDTINRVKNMHPTTIFSSTNDALENCQLILGGRVNTEPNVNTSTPKPKVKLFIYGMNNDEDEGVPIHPIVVEDENGNPEFILTSRKTGTGKPDAHFYGDVTVDSSAQFKGDVTVDSSFLPPIMTNEKKNALTAVAGMMIYNTTTGKHEGYNGSEWQPFYT
jgi:hypothetical protein